MKVDIKAISDESENRYDFCINLINSLKLAHIVEIGVYRGDFAHKILQSCPSIDSYTMIDPWRKLSEWNKPANQEDLIFEEFYKETLRKTDFAKQKRIILRGKTSKMIHQVMDQAIDLAYIDGDHTLKGITIDLIGIWPKIKENGFIVGDDFSPTIWQHQEQFEPTLVFPFAIHFAEAVDCPIFALKNNQFIILKENDSRFEFIDLTNGKYPSTALRDQLNTPMKRISRSLKRTYWFKRIQKLIKG